MNILKWVADNSRWVWGQRGGGSETQVISAPPAPSAGETAADIAKARLQYDPQIAQLEMGLQQQYVPQQTELYNQLLQQYGPGAAQLQTDIQAQQMPQLQALQQQLFPQQSQVLEAGAGQALGAFSPQLQQLQAGGQQQALSALQQPQNPLLQALGGQATQQLQPNLLAQLGGVESVMGLQQSPLQQQLSQQAQAGLTPTGLSPDQQAAMDAIRGRATQQVQQQARGRAQLGGGLFGGRAEQMEGRAVGELQQGFAAEDVNRLMQQRGQAQQFGLQTQGLQEQARQSALQQLFGAAGLGPGLQQQAIQSGLGVAGQQAQSQQQALMNAFATQQAAQQQAQPFMNILYPQAAAGQQAQPSQFGFQSAVPDPNAQLNAVTQLLGTQGIMPGEESPWAKAAGSGMGIGTMKLIYACIPEGTIIDTREGQKKVEGVRAGDIVYDKDNKLSKVLMKYEFDEPKTNNRFIEMTFENGSKITTCDLHRIDRTFAIDLKEGEKGLVSKKFVTMDKRSYDILTNGRDGSYRSSSIGIDSMIPELHEMTKKLQEA